MHHRKEGDKLGWILNLILREMHLEEIWWSWGVCIWVEMFKIMLLLLLRSKQCSVKCVYLFRIWFIYEEKHGSRIFRTHTDFNLAVHRSYTRNLTPVPICTIALLLRTMCVYVDLHICAVVWVRKCLVGGKYWKLKENYVTLMKYYF
jgi:hypothetical protein